MRKIPSLLRKFFVLDGGATMMEYGLVVALIALVCLASVTVIGTTISGFLNQAQPSM